MEQIGKILGKIHPGIPDPKTMMYEAPDYKCKTCHDAGVVYPVIDNEPDYGRSILCRDCVKPERLRNALNVSSLGATFDVFKKVPGTEKAFRAASAISTLETEWKQLLMYGDNGCGKTHLLEAIALYLYYEKGIQVRIVHYPDFIGSLKNTFDHSENKIRFEEIINKFSTDPFLLIDDMGVAGSDTEWSFKQLERIMLPRYKDNLFTVITTNLDPQRFPKFIRSRFNDAEKCRVIFNEGTDYRPRKGKQWGK